MANLFREALRVILPLFVVVAFSALGLRLLGMVPHYLESLADTEIENYSSVEEAEQELGIDIELPAYFPDFLVWPPAKVSVQRKPVLMISTYFLSRERGSEALIIHQIMIDRDETPFDLPKPSTVLKEVRGDMDGREAVLILGRDENSTSSNQLRWKADRRYFIVSTIYSADELTKIAKSLRHKR